MNAPPEDPGRTEPTEPTVANIARTYDYMLGGKEHFAVDRAFADRLIAQFPGTLDVIKGNREFLAYAVHAVTEEGIRQFLDIGSGLPTTGNTHQIAREATGEPLAVVYVDNDPVVVEHASRLVAGLPWVHALEGDAADPAAILAAATSLPAGALDPARPIAVIMCCVLHFVARPPGEILPEYLAALAPGSVLIMTHGTGDPESIATAERHYRGSGMAGFYGRPAAELEAALAGWDVRPPGLARVEMMTAGGAGGEGEAPRGWLAAVIADKPMPDSSDDQG